MKTGPFRWMRFMIIGLLGLLSFTVAACDGLADQIDEIRREIREQLEEEFAPDPNRAFNDVFDKVLEFHYSQPSEASLWEGAIAGLLAGVSDEALVEEIETSLDLDVHDEETFMLVFAAINEHYETELPEGAFWNFARQGVVDSLDDPYSAYFDREEYERIMQGMGESFVGIGVGVENYGENIRILTVFSESPAERAGLMPGDIITHVDGEDFTERSYNEAIAALLGDIDTTVEVGIERAGVEETIFVEMVREEIPTPSAEGRMIDDGESTIAMIKINSFGLETADIVGGYLEEFGTEGFDGLVIDVRNNGGGALGTLNDVLEFFLVGSMEEPFFSIEWVDGTVQVFYSDANNVVDVPVVVLVNEFSASASEVFAAAMYEQGGFDIIGVSTFGKGSVQSSLQVAGAPGDRLNLTTGLWFTPSNENVNDVGFEPNIIVEQNPYLYTPSLFVGEATYEIGDEASAVELLQRILNALGYGDDLVEDGVFDEATETALIAYQNDHEDLDATGILDALSAQMLSSDLYEYRIDIQNDTQYQYALDHVRSLILED